MEKVVLVWHAHHQENSPLENLYSFREREDEITYQKSKHEDARSIAIRKKLFKKVKGGIKSLPPVYQKTFEAWQSAQKEEEDARKAYRQRRIVLTRLYSSPFFAKSEKEVKQASKKLDRAEDKSYNLRNRWYDLLQKPSKALLKVHDEQCGCGWKPWPDNDILKYYTGKV